MNQLLKAINALPLKGCEKLPGSRTCMDDIEFSFDLALRELGFSFVNYSLIQNNDDEEEENPNMDVTFTPIFNNFPDEWLNIYAQKKYYEYDAVLRTLEYMPLDVGLNYGTWEDARELAINSPVGNNQRQRNEYIYKVDEVFEKAANHQLCSGVYILHRTGAVQIIISLSSNESNESLRKRLSTESAWQTLLALTILTNYSIMNTRGCDQCVKNARLYGIQEIQLTQSQKEILRLFAEKSNATIQEIADAHGTTTDTVKYHLKAIRTKFNKPRISGYVLARFAIDHNLI